MELQINKLINAKLIKEELWDALGYNPPATIRTANGVTVATIDVPPQDESTVSAVFNAHDGSLLTAAQQLQADAAFVQDSALSQAATIPGWATWTETEALAWINANLSDGPEKTAITSLARMVIALRNARWPELEAGG